VVVLVGKLLLMLSVTIQIMSSVNILLELIDKVKSNPLYKFNKNIILNK
jgi:hypothetical protein